jgi:formate-dependent nitrite reductase membrane component NrfD
VREATEPPGNEGWEPAPTYYEQPLLKAPHWEWNVVTYLFMGGVMGGLGLIQLLADGTRDDERRLQRTARIASLALAAANPAVLITHLGRPERFLNMMRIVKFKSPMSLGVWGLVLYSGTAGANVFRILPGVMAPLQALLGAFISGYTGVLLSATANPFWSSGKRHIPAASVCSGLGSACALSTMLSVFEGNAHVTHKLERLETIASAAELVILLDFRKHAGVYGKPFFEGARGKKLRTMTFIGGILAPMALNLLGSVVKLPKPVDAARSVAASTLTMIGGYVLRESLIEAGKASARDPRAAFVQPA